ncbi:MAG: hypothetical protein MZW92_39915 [Comamonadaceae bacterium]|nr:hypothetical protein [Comamonadaceae bacterium]
MLIGAARCCSARAALGRRDAAHRGGVRGARRQAVAARRRCERLLARDPKREGSGVTACASVCVFCGSQPGARPSTPQAARELGARWRAQRASDVVYGGGHVGMMGALADSGARRAAAA